MITPTAASYCDFAEATKQKTSAPLSVCCRWPRHNSLRRAVAQSMVEVHRISQELADYHVSQMDFSELRLRVKFYAGTELAPQVSGPVSRVAKGAIGNLTIHGMGARAGKPVLPDAGCKEFPRGNASECSDRQDAGFRERAFGFEVLT